MSEFQIKLTKSGKNVKIKLDEDEIKVKLKHLKMFIQMLHFRKGYLLSELLPIQLDGYVINKRFQDDNAVINVYETDKDEYDCAYAINNQNLYGLDEFDRINVIDRLPELINLLTGFYFYHDDNN